jgi:hypothetical protein
MKFDVISGVLFVTAYIAAGTPGFKSWRYWVLMASLIGIVANALIGNALK